MRMEYHNIRFFMKIPRDKETYYSKKIEIANILNQLDKTTNHLIVPIVTLKTP